MRTITINPQNKAKLTLPVVQVSEEYSSFGDELYLVTILEKPVAAILADCQDDAEEWLKEGALTELLQYKIEEDEDGERTLVDVELEELSNVEVIYMENSDSFPKWEEEFDDKWYFTIERDKPVDNAIVVAEYKGLNYWSSDIQLSEEKPDNKVELNGDTYEVIFDFDDYQRDAAQTALDEMIEEVENDTLKTLLKRNSHELVNDLVDLADFDAPDAYHVEVKNESYWIAKGE